MSREATGNAHARPRSHNVVSRVERLAESSGMTGCVPVNWVGESRVENGMDVLRRCPSWVGTVTSKNSSGLIDPQ